MRLTVEWLVMLSLASLSGCYQYVPIVKPVPLCEPTEKTALETCEHFQRVQDGQTYGDALKLNIENEARLSRCAAKQNNLAEALGLCNKEYRKLNHEVEAINKKIEANNQEVTTKR